jgi:hypothetical protein
LSTCFQVSSYAWPSPNTPALTFSGVSIVFSRDPSAAGGPASMTAEATIDCAFPASYVLPDADTIRNMVAGALRASSVVTNLTTVASNAANDVNVAVSPLKHAFTCQLPEVPVQARCYHACSSLLTSFHPWLSAWVVHEARRKRRRKAYCPSHLCCHLAKSWALKTCAQSSSCHVVCRSSRQFRGQILRLTCALRCSRLLKRCGGGDVSPLLCYVAICGARL